MVVFAIAENGLSFVVFGTVAFSLVMSVLFLVTRGKDSMYDQIGQGGLSRESDHAGGAPGPPLDSPAAAAEREQEVRQMLRARSERLERRGLPGLDIDAEVARLLAPPGRSERDPGRRAQRATGASGPATARRRCRGRAHPRGAGLMIDTPAPRLGIKRQ